MKNTILRGFIALTTIAASTSAALAHHPMGGKTPSTFMEGLLSGVGHPVIGMDHLAFVVAMGVAAVMAGKRYLLPLFFIIATLAGTGLHLAAIDLPVVELVVALSVAAIGILILSGREIATSVYAALFTVAGLFHGHAYGEAIFGAETTPLVAYLAGFGITQYVIAIVAGGLAASTKTAFENTNARIAGGVVAGVGALLVSEHVLAAIFGA